MHQTVADRIEAIKQFIATQVNAIRQDPDMSDTMFEVLRDSAINEVSRFMEFMAQDGLSQAYNEAFDAGYMKALEHVKNRHRRPPKALQVSDIPDDLEVTVKDVLRRRFRIGSLVLPGHRLQGIPQPLWDSIRNAVRQMRHRTGRQYHIEANKDTGMMTVTLVRLGDADTRLANGKRRTLTHKLRTGALHIVG